MKKRGQEMWDAVVEATKDETLLLALSFFRDDEQPLHCPLGCAITHMTPEENEEASLEYDDEDFQWEYADMETQIDCIWGDDVYSEYDRLVRANYGLDIIPTVQNSKDFRIGELVLPKDLALRFFRQAIEEVYGDS